jgi:LuxR family transcriptional regulator, maltose regulon positive regulatory protein
VKVETLGSFTVLLDDAPVEFGRKVPKKPLQLLKALIALGGRGYRRGLADILWPDEQGGAAHTACGTTLTRLIMLAGDVWAIVQVGGCRTIDRNHVWVDGLEFESLLNDARCGARPDVDECVQTAIAYYRGSFLGDEPDAPWAVSARERLRVKFVGAASAPAKRQEKSGELASAVELYRRHIEVDELTEDF